MRKIIAALAGLAALTYGADRVLAASPSYCALYAKEFVKRAAAESQGSISTGRIHDRAYHRCLNLDDEPPMPTAYTDPETDGSVRPSAAPEGSGEAATDQPDGARASTEAESVEGDAGPDPDPPPAEAQRKSGSWRGSGYAMWSKEWRAWCRAHFPNSFDPETGTVVPYKTGVRTACR